MNDYEKNKGEEIMMLPHVHTVKGNLFTDNFVPGYNPFNERVVIERGEELREWNPTRSKLGAAVVKGMRLEIKEGWKVLYMGAAHGYTPSRVATIVGKNGIVYGVEMSERCFNNLLPLTEKYTNIVPIMSDCRKTENYDWVEKVDLVYCDIADRQMTIIAVDNCRKFLKPNGMLMLAVKSRSIDVTESPRKIVQQQVDILEKEGFEILEWKMLDPFEKDHGFIVARMK
jgi:fibrillarin-like pre-rRNA processing protein